MRIYTWIHLDLKNGGGILHAEDYDGPVALAGGGGTEVVNETVPTGPYGPQIPYILGLFQEAANLYNQGAPQAYGSDGQPLTPDINPNIQNTYDTVGGLAGGNIDQNQQIQQILQMLAGTQNPASQVGEQVVPGMLGGIDEQLGAGDNALTDLAQGQTGNVGGAFNTVFGQTPGGPLATGTQGGQTDASSAIQTLLGGGGQNPYLDAMVQGAMQGQYNSFDRNILPGIRAEAQQAGQIGGTRQGIAEGIAAGDLLNQERLVRENIYGNAFSQQLGAQGNVVSNLLQSQLGDQSAALNAEQLANQNYQQYIQSLLQGTQQAGGFLGQGLGLGYDAIGSGTAQAGNLFNQGNSLQLNQMLQSLGLIPGFQAQSLGQLGAVNQLGLQEYGLGQNSIDALMEQYYFNQNSPFNLLSQYQQYVTGPYGGTVYQTNPYAGYGIPIGPNSPGGGGPGPSPYPNIMGGYSGTYGQTGGLWDPGWAQLWQQLQQSGGVPQPTAPPTMGAPSPTIQTALPDSGGYQPPSFEPISQPLATTQPVSPTPTGTTTPTTTDRNRTLINVQ